jgi:hypothetical protein
MHISIKTSRDGYSVVRIADEGDFVVIRNFATAQEALICLFNLVGEFAPHSLLLTVNEPQ